MYNAYTAKGGIAVTPSDTLTLAQQGIKQIAQRLWIGGAGNVTVTMEDGTVLTWDAATAGCYLEARVTQVWATQAAAVAAATAAGYPTTGIGATTATNILALY